jgi:hypothetical protein
MVRDGSAVSDVLVRVDARRMSPSFLSDLVKVARKHHLLLRLSNGRAIPPVFKTVLAEIRESSAFRFSQDPKSFIESLETAARQDPDD